MADLKHRLTVLFINLFLGGYVGQEEVEFKEYRDTVYLFEGETAGGINFCWNKILMQEKLFEERNGTSREHVYLHEIGHRQEPTILELLNGAFQWSIHPAIILIELVFIFGAITSYFLQIPNENLVGILRSGALAAILHIPIAITASKLLETIPDLFVIRKIGKERFLEGREELKNLYSDRSLTDRAFSRLTHPTTEFVIRIAGLIDTSS